MESQYTAYIPVLKAISDETRLKIIDMISCGEICACDILDSLDIKQATLSYHMKMLSECGLVNARRDGAWMRYTLNKEKTDSIITFISQITNKKNCNYEKRCSDECK
ncbi:MAG: ArsR/SmtB family transcription factor [Dethiobacteraceae bacterium]